MYKNKGVLTIKRFGYFVLYFFIFLGDSQFLDFNITLYVIHIFHPSGTAYSIIRWVPFFSLLLSILLLWLTRYISKRSKRLFIFMLLIQIIPTIYYFIMDIGVIQTWNDPIRIPVQK